MKIITWNCNGALRKKTELLDQLNADILVIQECEDPNRSTISYKQWANDFLWKGASKNKGLGIFAKNKNQLTELNWTGEYFPSQLKRHVFESTQLETFIPCMINNQTPLLGVWTKRANSKAFKYIGQLWLYLQIHKHKLSSENQIICGDFNSNSIWDSWDRWWNHSDVVEELKEIGLLSLYHEKKMEEHGKESEATFYMYRNPEKQYHIDYAFISKPLIHKAEVKIYNPKIWLELSDHIPMEITISG